MKRTFLIYIKLFNEFVVPDGQKIKSDISQISDNMNAYLAKSFNPRFTQDLEDIDEHFYRTRMIINIRHITP